LATCPFCENPINADLEVYGGTCPHCFGEIPGEDAATDPGEAVKQAQDAEDAAHARRRSQRPLIFGGVAVALFMSFVGYRVFGPKPVIEPIRFDGETFALSLADLETYDEEEAALWAEPDPEPAPRRVAANKPRRTSEPSTVDPTNDDFLSAAAASGGSLGAAGGMTDDIATDDAPTGGTRRALRSSSGASKDPGVRSIGTGGTVGTGDENPFALTSGAVEQRRQTPLLTDPAEITQVAKRLVRQNQRRLLQCYDRALKTNEDLEGQWMFSFTIETDGSVTANSVEATTVSDSELEACFFKNLDRWRIPYRLESPRPVADVPLKFEAG